MENICLFVDLVTYYLIPIIYRNVYYKSLKLQRKLRDTESQRQRHSFRNSVKKNNKNQYEYEQINKELALERQQDFEQFVVS